MTGANFGLSSTVTVRGRNAISVIQSHTLLCVSTPPGFGTHQAVIVTGADQSTSVSQIYDYSPIPTTSLDLAGNAAPTSFPLARVLIDYLDGTASITTISLSGRPQDLTLPPGLVAQVYWKIESDRDFNKALLCLQCLEEEIEGMLEQGFVLYTSQTPDGPWVEVSNQSIDLETNTICGRVSQFSYFILSGPVVPVSMSHENLE